MARKLIGHEVQFIATVRWSLSIKAESFEDALAQARAMKCGEALDALKGGFLDDYDNFEVTGVFK